jgi:putative sigma-54 modulation protein
MNIAITFRQMDATDSMKNFATEKFAKLQKFLRQPLHGQLTLSCTHGRIHSAEVELHSGPSRFHAHESSEDMYATIDMVIDKVDRQIREANKVTASKKKGAERASEHLLPESSEE